MRKFPHNVRIARNPVGNRPQHLTRTAVGAYLAERLAGLSSSRVARDEWFANDLGVMVRSNGVDRARGQLQGATRPWLLINEGALPMKLDRVLVIFPGKGARRPTLIRRLRQLGTVRQLTTTRSRRDIFCVVVYRADHKDRVFRSIEELSEPFIWDEILDEDRAVEADLWATLTREFAQDDALLSE